MWSGLLALTMKTATPRFLLLAILFDGARAWQLTSVRRHGSVRMAVSADTFRDCAIYDSEMESKLEDMKARLASAEVRETSMRDLVGKAQIDLGKQDEMRKALKAEVEELKSANEDLEAQLKTKTEEVEKFVNGVETELTQSREKAQALSQEMEKVKAELAERTEEVTQLNLHLEAHTGATVRLNKEVAELKEKLEKVQAAAA